MAVNESRSLNGDLALGIADGQVKNLTPDRGGVVSSTPAEAELRQMLMPDYDAAAYGRSQQIARRVTQL